MSVESMGIVIINCFKFSTLGDHSTDSLVRMLVRKNVEKGSDFGPVTLTTTLEKRVQGNL